MPLAPVKMASKAIPTTIVELLVVVWTVNVTLEKHALTTIASIPVWLMIHAASMLNATFNIIEHNVDARAATEAMRMKDVESLAVNRIMTVPQISTA